MPEATDDLLELTVAQLEELQERHFRAAGPIQRAVRRVASVLGRPGSIAVILIAIAAWVGGNIVARIDGRPAVEQAPFSDTALVVTIAAFLISLLILSAQRFDEELADRRSQLTLQLAMLSERKLAKIIFLLEEQRRDNFLLEKRHDPEALELAKPIDLAASIDRIEAGHRKS